MPHHVPLRAGDPRRVGRYRLTGRLGGLPSEDPLFMGAGPDGIAVAISLLGGAWARDGAARDRFAAEAAVAKRVPPFCAARVLDAGLDGDSAYLVSEFVPGRSLFELVAEEGVRHGSELEALAIGMATGLASVHQAGLVHGSFGPQYLILPPEGAPRVVEFGITPPYGSATPSADMYAWAQTVVFAATGHPPSGRGDLDMLPGRTREPVEQCLGLDSPERPPARAVLQFLLGDGPPAAGLLAEGSRRAARFDVPSQPPAEAVATVPAEVGAPRAAIGRARQARPDPLPAPRQPRPRETPPARHPAGRDALGGSRHSGGNAVSGQRDPARGGSTRGRAQPASRHPAVWAISGAAVVVVVLLALLIPHLVEGGSPASRGNRAADTHRPAATLSPTLSPSLGPTTPAAFGGTWSGQVTQSAVTYTVTVTLASGDPSGTIAYSGADFNCSGDLSLTSATSTSMTMSQGIVVGRKTCSDGTVTLALSGASAIDFNFRQSSTAATGTLTRQ
jgi:serine/threonine protein kinase